MINKAIEDAILQINLQTVAVQLAGENSGEAPKGLDGRDLAIVEMTMDMAFKLLELGLIEPAAVPPEYEFTDDLVTSPATILSQKGLDILSEIQARRNAAQEFQGDMQKSQP